MFERGEEKLKNIERQISSLFNKDQGNEHNIEYEQISKTIRTMHGEKEHWCKCSIHVCSIQGNADNTVLVAPSKSLL